GDLIASHLEPWIPVRDSGPTIAPAAPVTEPAQRPEPSAAPSEAAPVAPALPSPPDPELLNLIGEVQLTAQQQQAALETLEDQVARLQVTLNGQQERLRALSTTTREDWLLAEAQYLLRLANQRILTERDGANAL